MQGQTGGVGVVQEVDQGYQALRDLLLLCFRKASEHQGLML